MIARPQIGLAVMVAAAAAACGGSSSGGGSTAAQNQQTQPAQQTPAASSPAAVQHPKSLIGEVGKDDKFVISLKDQNGADITNLAAGTYSLKVQDDSSIHNFHLSGGGIEDSTDVGGTGVKTFSVTFKRGTYTFMCDPHSATMHGDFTVS